MTPTVGRVLQPIAKPRFKIAAILVVPNPKANENIPLKINFNLCLSQCLAEECYCIWKHRQFKKKKKKTLIIY